MDASSKNQVEMNHSADLRAQLERLLEANGISQYRLAQYRSVSPQAVHQALSGPSPIVAPTVEAVLELTQHRIALAPQETDRQAVYDRALTYGHRLFPKSPPEHHHSFAGCVAWLATGDTTDLSNTLRSLAVQQLYRPTMTFADAVMGCLPLVYGPLEDIHRQVALLGSQGDPHWDRVQLEMWRTGS